MIDIAEVIAGWIYSLQITSPGQWLLRLALLLSGVAAGLLVLPWVPLYLQPVWGGLLIVLLVASVVRPDTVAPLLAIVVVAVAWFMGGGSAAWWLQLALVGVVSIFHLTSAHAAAAPSYAAITRRAGARMSLMTLLFAGVSVLVALAVWAVTLLPAGVLPRGVWWVVAGVVAAAVVTVVVAVRLRDTTR